MTDANAKVLESVREALLSSGFPLQTRIRHEILASPGWTVHASEYPWQGPGGDDRFLDLVATNGRLVLTIECKKTTKEILTFLLPLGHSGSGEREDFRCLYVVQTRDLTGRPEICCEEWPLHPRSRCAEFCIVSTSESGRDHRLLERDAGLVIRATEAFALDSKEYTQAYSRIRLPCLLLPIIVTNAPIYVARYDPANVSLETGEFPGLPQEIDRVSCVRFRKSFTSEGGRDLGDRSVFVVSAAWLPEFLKRVAAAPMIPQVDRASVRFLPRTLR